MAKGFHGGLWLDTQKHPVFDRPIEILEAPRSVALPLRQHAGTPCVPVVKKGSRVAVGQPVAQAGEGISCGLHSPVSGVVKEVAADGPSPRIVIENDGRDTAYPLRDVPDPGHMKPGEITAAAKAAAITSAGGLGRPLWYRLTQMTADSIDTVVLNAVETEPYVSVSTKLLTESPEDVARGLSLVMRATGASNAVLAVGDDLEHDALTDIMQSYHLQGVDLDLHRVLPKYPAGNEKYLGPLLFGDQKEKGAVKAGYVSAEECVMLSRAIVYGLPQISKVVTVAGSAVGNPQNMEVRIGTPVRAVLEHCGLIFDPDRVILGSIMRGTAVTSLDVPVTKDVNAVLALVTPKHDSIHPMCINCGRCVRVCPEKLMPNYIAMRAVLADFEACAALHIDSCIECGACAYICPGRMPIVELIKNIKKAAVTSGTSLE